MSTVDISINTGPDPKALALHGGVTVPLAVPPARSPEKKRYKRFLRGPIPLGWLCRAAALPGRALQIAIAIWYRAGMQGATGVKVTNILATEFGVDRHAKTRALHALEGAGLVAIKRKAGRSPIVDLLEVEEKP